MIALLLIARLADAACPSDGATLEQLIHQGTEAFETHHLSPFNRARAEFQSSTSCLTDVVDSRTVAGYYRLQGLALYQEGLEFQSEMMRDFQAACILDPAYRFSPKAVPEGHEIRDFYDDACDRPPFVELPLPETRFQVFVDGRAVLTYPANRQMVLEVVTPGGRVRWSGLVRADEDSDLPSILTGSRRRTAALWLGGGSLGLGAAAGGLFAAARLTGSSFYDVSGPVARGEDYGDDIPGKAMGLATRANRLGYAAQIVGGTAVVLGTSAVLVVPW